MNKNFDFTVIRQKLKEEILKLPYAAGVEAVEFSKSRFVQQNWVDHGTAPWKKRNSSSRKDDSRAILVKSGRLKRSIRIINTTNRSVTIGTDVPYAEIHNDGFRGTQSVKSHSRNLSTKVRVGTGKYTKTGRERTRTMKQIKGTTTVRAYTRSVNLPRRRFLGESAVLNQRIKRLIELKLQKVFNHQ